MDQSRIILEFNLRVGKTLRAEDPRLINGQIVAEAWHLLSDFLIDVLDDLDHEPSDEEFRELFIELCYKLACQEACTLFLMPHWEKNFAERLAKGKRVRQPPTREELC